MQLRVAAPFLAALVTLTACERALAPALPAAIAAVTPEDQQGVVGTPVEHAPGVRVTGQDGRPVSGVEVHFTVAGGGTVSSAQVVTDARGEARLAAWRLGPVAGEQVVTAAAGIGPSAASPTVVFRATARPGAAARLALIVAPAGISATGSVLMPAPVVQALDEFGNETPAAGIAVTAAAQPASVQLEDHVATTNAHGRAEFPWLRLTGESGNYSLSFSAPNLTPATLSSSLSLVPETPGICSGAVPLAFALGETRRVTLDRPRGLNCLDYDHARSAGQQYLILVENMPMFGEYGTALYDATRFGQPQSSAEFSYALRSAPRDAAGQVVLGAARQLLVQQVPEQHAHAWDFGAGPIYELQPEPPPGGVPEPWIERAGGQRLDAASTAASPAVGDTIRGIRMEPLPHLGIAGGLQSAVVRYVSSELIIAEDVRLASLQRQGGGFNTPLHPDTLHAIAQEYSRHARQQSDLLFDGRHNAAVETVRGGRVIAVHSIMYATNIWGYTYSSGDYFVFDYWVGSNGTTGGLNQRVQRVVDNLFMHEIAHMRELGMLQRAAVTNRRGNRWFVEGFARFTERQPIAARLLEAADPSRTANGVLPLNPIFGGSFFRDDVPTYLNMPASVFSGYQNSSYIFDYFADQVALQGGDWRAALREFIVAAGRPDVIDALTLRWTGATLPELFTRARLALYLDDIGTAALPAWTQYHQFQLRASRPPTTAAGTDPRNSFVRLVPGQGLEVTHTVAPGAAWGYVIDGTQATGNGRFSLTGPATANAVLSITRIR
jgi:hypothetical protein